MRYLIVGNNIRRDISVRDLPFCQIRILNAQDRLKIRHRKAEARKFRRIHFNPNRRQRAASSIHLPDALNLRKPLLNDRRRLVIQLVRTVFIRCQPDNHDRRIRRIDLAISRISRQVCRQVGARSIDRGLNVARSSIDIAAQIKLNRNRRCAQTARRRHLRHPGNMSELPFQWCRHR